MVYSFSQIVMMDQVGPAQTSAELQRETWQFNTVLYLIFVFQPLILLFQGLFSVTYDCLTSIVTMWGSFQKPLEMRRDCISPCALATCCWFFQRTLINLWGRISLYNSHVGGIYWAWVFLTIFSITSSIDINFRQCIWHGPRQEAPGIMNTQFLPQKTQMQGIHFAFILTTSRHMSQIKCSPI